MTFGSLGGGEDGEYNDFDFVEMSKIFATQDAYFSLDSAYTGWKRLVRRLFFTPKAGLIHELELFQMERGT